MTLPPRPPSPPSGPPIGMNFSRRKLAQPAPPLPAAMSMTTSSTNFMALPGATEKRKSPGAPGLRLPLARVVRSGRVDRHGLAAQRTLGGETDAAVDQSEQRVILAGADVRAGVELGAALAHDHRAGRHYLTAEGLHAEHLGLGVTAVPGGAAAF